LPSCQTNHHVISLLSREQPIADGLDDAAARIAARRRSTRSSDPACIAFFSLGQSYTEERAFKSYDGLADGFRHYSIVQDGGKNADAVLPIVHVPFSNLKTWLNGTFHGVSEKHLPRYARKWNYRFNRRRSISDLARFLLRRAATRSTITYQQIVNAGQINGEPPALTG
jgi:hypothetical protein